MNKRREIGDIVFTIGLTKEKNEEWLYEITKREIFKVDEVYNNVCYTGYHNEMFYICYDSLDEARENARLLGSKLVKNLNDIKFKDATSQSNSINNIEILQKVFPEKQTIVLPKGNETTKTLVEESLTGGIFDFM